MLTKILANKNLTQLKSITQKATFFNYFNYGNYGIGDIEHVHHTDPGHDPSVWTKPELFTNKYEKDVIPDTDSLATGKERIEHMALSEGKDPYYGLMDALEFEGKGTKEKPIEVLSGDVDRIVGCTGYDGHGHSLTWMMVTKDGHKYWEFGHNRCPECGNVYKLKQVDLPYPTIL